MKLLPLTLLVLLVPIAQNDRVLPSPKPNLVAVHWPDLSTVEGEVRGHLLQAQTALTRAVRRVDASDVTLSEAYGSTGQTFHAYSFNAPARECYVNAARLAPKDFRWPYLTAKLDQQDGRVEDAIKNYQLAQSLNPSYVAASINLGNIFLEANRLSEARQHFAAALKIDEQSPAADYGLGQVALSERNYAEAVRYFEKTLAIVSAANRVHYSLAMAYRGLGDVEKAKAHLRLQGTVGVRAADPLLDQLQEIVQGERLHLIRGRSALEAKRYAEAADEFRKAVAARPESVAGRVNLGAALNLLGDQRGAIEQFEEALRIAPDNANAHYNLGVLFVVQKRHAEAITHLEFVLKSNPSDTATTIMLARLLATSPNYEVRNGARALELAQRTYKETGSLEHGAVISLALAELGRCADALEWQRKLIDAAQRSEQISVAEKLKRDLPLYERSPCRPPS